MNTLLCAALNRTLLLMRDELCTEVTDAELLGALTDTSVALIIDDATASAHSAQSAVVTAAMLMARSGHQVHLVFPTKIQLDGDQSPLRPGNLLDELMRIGPLVMPGYQFEFGIPKYKVDIACIFGDSECAISATRTIFINATDWRAMLNQARRPWIEQHWPVGALAVAALAAAEVFKVAMQKLRRYARNRLVFDELFAPCRQAALDVAPPNTPHAYSLGDIDLISGGAITNAALYSLLRVRDGGGRIRVIEPDISDLTNLNRYMLLTLKQIRQPKIEILSSHQRPSITISGVQQRFTPILLRELSGFARSVLVGVDDIPSRWTVQRGNPIWLGIGATTHWSAMSSFHANEVACAQCCHPYDDPMTGPIPTIAFVSFLSGVLLTGQFLVSRNGSPGLHNAQQIYVTPLRPESPWISPVARRIGCPTCFDRATLAA